MLTETQVAARLSDTVVVPGFDDPVHEAQGVFRCVLEAMAHPGRVLQTGARPQAPAPLHSAAAALCLALTDLDTPVWLQPESLANVGEASGLGEAFGPALASWLRFHCGCPMTTDPAAAAFALIHAPLNMPPLAAFSLGEPEYPDRSTTLIIQIEGFDSEAGGVTLNGPGIRDRQSFAPVGLHENFWTQWRENAALFPLGVDVILVAGNDIAALPRTTQVRA